MIEVVVAKRPSRARRAARSLGSKTLAISALQLKSLTPEQHQRLQSCSLVLITTPDDVIAPVARQLSEIFLSRPAGARGDKSHRKSHRVVLHTSGALAADVLKPMRRAGFVTGSLHPLVSISEAQSGAKSLAGAFFSVEGDPSAIRCGKSIVKDLGGESFTIDSGHKPLYHAAALTASPNMTALFEIAVDMLGVCGLNPGRARRILLPLVDSTVTNLATLDPAKALTGTFQRGDISTVKMHLAALRAANLPQALAAYVVLGQRSLAMAQRRGAKVAGLLEIQKLLARNAESLLRS
jgi:predicted short-subunit dehydrogenase-like oxidoreductase (DUF2520 family)